MKSRQELYDLYPRLLGTDNDPDLERLVGDLDFVSDMGEPPAYVAASLDSALAERVRACASLRKKPTRLRVTEQTEHRPRRRWLPAFGATGRALNLAGLAAFILIVGVIGVGMVAMLSGRQPRPQPATQQVSSLGTVTKSFRLTLNGKVYGGEVFALTMDAEDVNHQGLIMFCGKDPAVAYADSGKTCQSGKTYTVTRTFPTGAKVNFAYSAPYDEAFFGCYETMTDDSTATATYIYGPGGGRGEGECGGNGREAEQRDGKTETPQPTPEVLYATPVPAQLPLPTTTQDNNVSRVMEIPASDQHLALGSLAGAASLLAAVGYIALRRR